MHAKLLDMVVGKLVQYIVNCACAETCQESLVKLFWFYTSYSSLF